MENEFFAEFKQGKTNWQISCTDIGYTENATLIYGIPFGTSIGYRILLASVPSSIIVILKPIKHK